MQPRFALRLDLVENVLEERALMASFLDSTFFQYSLSSGMSVFTDWGSSNSLAMTNSGGPIGLEGGNLSTETGAFGSNFAAGSSYFGFGNNPFGSGLSPLDGVVAGYSMNTALSSVLGNGSSLPGDGSLDDGFNPFVPGGNASLRAGAVGGPVNVKTGAGDLNGPVGYGSSFSSGGNFNYSLISGIVYKGRGAIGTLSASASGSGSFEEPLPPKPGADQNPNPKDARPAEKPLNKPADQAPARREQAPKPKPATPTPSQPRRLPPLPASEGRETVPTGPVRQSPQESNPPAPPAETAPQGESQDGLTMLLDAILKVPFAGRP